MDITHHYDSPLGGITMACNGDALTGLWFDGQKYFAATLTSEHEEKNSPLFDLADRWLDLYFSGSDPGFLPPISVKTTAFRRIVWKILLTIPYGETRTYKEIAQLVSEERGLSQMSAQAVGGAIAHNAISLIIPCHRVLGTDGSMTGYAGGIERKIWLLEKEKMIRQ